MLASPGRWGWKTVDGSGPATFAVASTCAALRASSTSPGGDVRSVQVPRFGDEMPAPSLGLRKEEVEGGEVGTGQPAVQDGTARHLTLDLAEHAQAAEPHSVDQQV